MIFCRKTQRTNAKSGRPKVADWKVATWNKFTGRLVSNRNESVRAEIGQILQTHTRVSYSSIDKCQNNIVNIHSRLYMHAMGVMQAQPSTLTHCCRVNNFVIFRRWHMSFTCVTNNAGFALLCRQQLVLLNVFIRRRQTDWEQHLTADSGLLASRSARPDWLVAPEHRDSRCAAVEWCAAVVACGWTWPPSSPSTPECEGAGRLLRSCATHPVLAPSWPKLITRGIFGSCWTCCGR